MGTGKVRALCGTTPTYVFLLHMHLSLKTDFYLSYRVLDPIKYGFEVPYPIAT